MNSLYLVRQDDGEITIAEFSAIIGDLPGTRDLRTENLFRASADVHYFYEDDRTIIRLSEDQQMIAITGTGKASVRAIFEIQKRYAHPLRSFDMDYSYDITVTGVTSIEELRRRIGMPE